MSLEEAEPIPDISWAIRVLQPPPEQENVQYGELGWGRETRPEFPSTQHLWPPSVPLGVLSWGSLGCMLMGSSVWVWGMWVPTLGIGAGHHQANCSVVGKPRPKHTTLLEASDHHTSPRMLS